MGPGRDASQGRARPDALEVPHRGRGPAAAYRLSGDDPQGHPEHGRHKKQSGGHGQFGDVKIEIRPRQRGEGFEFVDKIVGGSVPRQYIPAVEAGARDFLQRGPLGFPVVDVSVTLFDGQFHSVDSSEIAFRMATALALREGLKSCEPVLLEPILAVEISVPTDYTSRALQLVSQKRGQILGYDAKADWSGWDRISANIPQAEIHDLIVSLRSLSQGVAFFQWRYDHLNPVPDKLAETVVAHRQEELQASWNGRRRAEAAACRAPTGRLGEHAREPHPGNAGGIVLMPVVAPIREDRRAIGVDRRGRAGPAGPRR